MGLFFVDITMNMYVNLCSGTNEKKDTLTVDLPPEYTDEFNQMVHILAEEKNITARRAFVDLVRNTFDNLMEKDYERKGRKNAKRRGRSS